MASTESPRESPPESPSAGWLAVIGPGVLVAATGVGAGDLVTASVAGSQLGLVILWSAVLGAVLKWAATEGIARWQMATGMTLLQGWFGTIGKWSGWLFLAYFLIWTVSVCGALAKACGVAADAILRIGEPQFSQIAWAMVHSAAGFVVAWRGGFRVFERIMSVLIGLMFVTVMATAVWTRPHLGEWMTGLLIPRIPSGGATLVVAVLGGVGGTVTMLSYGYWIREAGRTGEAGLRACRIDLFAGYAITALFGIAMIQIGSAVNITDDKSQVATELAGQLEGAMGPAGKWLFLLGFWGAVFSSLLGVWQGVPYLFADFLACWRGDGSDDSDRPLTSTPAYRRYLAFVALIPLVSVGLPLVRIQLIYAVLGALFMPLLATTLLILNSRRDLMPPRMRNGWLTTGLLIATVLFFAAYGAHQIWGKIAPLFQ